MVLGGDRHALAEALFLRTYSPDIVMISLTGEALTTFLSNVVPTFAHFHPVGVLLVAMLGRRDQWLHHASRIESGEMQGEGDPGGREPVETRRETVGTAAVEGPCKLELEGLGLDGEARGRGWARWGTR